MNARLVSAGEATIWFACFVLLAFLLVATGFSSSDPDSALYAGISNRLSQEPVSRWIAPEWWGFWPEAYMEGYFREHPAGVFLLPAALSKIGVPAFQGAYIVGAAAALGSLLMMASLIRRFAGLREARMALVLLQLMPVAFIFRIRANHEYPMLACLLIAVHGMVLASNRRMVSSTLLVAAGLTAGLFIKGVFVTKILLAVAIWIALDPLGERGARARCAAAAVMGIAAMFAGAVVYDLLYRAATGDPFWGLYWQRQMAPLGDVTPAGFALTLGRNLAFYISRLVWHPAPWSVALLVVAWRARRSISAKWRALDPRERSGLTYGLAFAALAILLVTPSARYAERYAFSATHAVACVGVVASCRIWPGLMSRISALDGRIPAFAAVVWLALALLRLGTGALVPRI